MQTQSTWRRDHYLFDVHTTAWQASQQQGTKILLSNNSNNCTQLHNAFDHGLIYHHHVNEKTPNNTQEFRARSSDPKLTYHCSADCDAVGSSIIFRQPREAITFTEDPFRLAAAQRELNKRASCSTTTTSTSSTSYLMDNDPSKRRKTMAGAS
ncbi:hypothetical protein BDA99DRAFT_503649 [Phascolomyces articulosus]|uniref:Uncharacterized protein n=1 Tax=Phascolomyces articulosus TaxID=60185 RepID=A0AAD5PFZ5_9FUNG|nr:hypothetical protein BDA99DRAFT_503649 [Phascolomyces articulosus]